MTAVRVHRFGGPEQLVTEQVPLPRPADGNVLVQVHAAGVNPIDGIARQEGDFGFGALPLPWIPGWDLAGTVTDGAPDLPAGTAVYGMVRMPAAGSTYAQYAAVPAAEVVPAPARLSHVEAAAVPMAALTAWRALFTEGGLRAGQRVLVHAAAGGVGHLAVPLARWAGAEVVATASAANTDFVRSLGADRVVDYRSVPFEEATGPVDVVLDAVGDDVLARSATVLRPGGTLVTLPWDPGPEVTARLRERHGVHLRWFSVEPDAAALRRITALLDDGVLAPTVTAVLPLAQAPQAHRDSDAGHVRGKLVLDTAG